MTQIFSDDGEVTPVTIIESLGVEFVQRISEEKRGYSAVQCKIKIRKREKLIEVRSSENDFAEMKQGDKFNEDQFSIGDKVSVVGVSKGKGFAGTIKRYGFSRGPMSHGSNQQRRVGSIGSAYPQHVMKGQKMPGRMGNSRVTVKNLTIVDVDNKNHLILVSGAVPGSRGSQIKVISE